MNQISTVLNELKDDVINHPITTMVHGASAPGSARKTEVISQSKIYIQRRGSFFESTSNELTDTKLESDPSYRVSQWDQKREYQKCKAIDVAILLQSKSHIVSNLCYGLLGGISLMQLVLTYTLVKGSKYEIMSFIELYSKFGFVPSTSFTVLTTICTVFAFDRIDLMTIKEQLKTEERASFSNWIILVLYSSMFILSVLCFKFDEAIATYPTGESAISVSEDLWIWKMFSLWKCIFGIIGWFVICITRPQDSLQLHLCSLQKETRKNNQNSCP